MWVPSGPCSRARTAGDAGALQALDGQHASADHYDAAQGKDAVDQDGGHGRGQGGPGGGEPEDESGLDDTEATGNGGEAGSGTQD